MARISFAVIPSGKATVSIRRIISRIVAASLNTGMITESFISRSSSVGKERHRGREANARDGSVQLAMVLNVGEHDRDELPRLQVLNRTGVVSSWEEYTA